MVPEPQMDCETLDLMNHELVLRDGRRIALRLQECVILGVLVQAVGDFQNKHTLAAAIYGHEDRWAESWAGVVRNNMSRLRKMTHDLDCSFTIVSHGRYANDAIGWRLTGKLYVIAAR